MNIVWQKEVLGSSNLPCTGTSGSTLSGFPRNPCAVLVPVCQHVMYPDHGRLTSSVLSCQCARLATRADLTMHARHDPGGPEFEIGLPAADSISLSCGPTMHVTRQAVVMVHL